jgi:hypothetical protein
MAEANLDTRVSVPLMGALAAALCITMAALADPLRTDPKLTAAAVFGVSFGVS